MEIIKLMIELSDESFQEAVVSLRMNKSLSKEFVDLLIDYTSSERTQKNKTIQTA
nr:MAG TPA: Rsbr N terminal [Caudoviricetes sp.]